MKKLFVIFFLALLSCYSLQVHAVSERDFKTFFLGQSIGYMSSLLADISSSYGTDSDDVMKNKVKRFSKSLEDQGNLIKTDIVKFPDNIYEVYRELIKEGKNKLSNPTIVKLNSLLALYYEEIGRWYYQQLPADKWVFDLGFYTSYQLTSINLHGTLPGDIKLLTGAERFLQPTPFPQDTNLIAAISMAGQLDKQNLSTKLDKNQIAELAKNLNTITTEFSNMTSSIEQQTPLSAQEATPEKTVKVINSAFIGKWNGNLTGPSGHVNTISLVFDGERSDGKMLIDGVDSIIKLIDLDILDNHIGFRIQPSAKSSFYLDFQGTLKDQGMSGSVIDSEGQVGKWFVSLKSDKQQPVPQSKASQEDIKSKDVLRTAEISPENQLTKPLIEEKQLLIDNLLGEWKGKIVEQNGAISSSTLTVDLINESNLLIHQGEKETKVNLNEFAVKDGYVVFEIKPQKSRLSVKFKGKVDKNLMEGKAEGSDGQVALWKFQKVANKKL